MATNDTIEFVLVLVILGISYWWFWNWADRQQRAALTTTTSKEYPVARVGSGLVPSLDPFVTKGSIVYIPAADGLYVTRISYRRKWRYNNGLKRWLRRGAHIHLIITLPNEPCCKVWQSVVNAFPHNFHFYRIDREKLVGPTAGLMKSQLEKLDTFHPVVVINPTGPFAPGAMWIEPNHPLKSKFAFDVQLVRPEDVSRGERFDKYKEMYQALLHGPHVDTLGPNLRRGVRHRQEHKEENERVPLPQ